MSLTSTGLKAFISVRLPAAECARRTKALEAWLKLRQEIGSTNAARQLGVTTNMMSYHAEAMGVPIPKIPSSIANNLRLANGGARNGHNRKVGK